MDRTEEQLNQDMLDQKEAEEFLKELRAMPYSRDKIGQVSVTTTFRKPFAETAKTEQNPQTEQN